MTKLYLIAFVANANAPAPEIVYAIGSQSASEQWFTDEGTQVWPFWYKAWEPPVDRVPEGWLEHLHAEAAKYAAEHKTVTQPKASAQSLLQSLGLNKSKPTQPIARRF